MWSKNAGILSNVNLPPPFFFFFCVVNLQYKKIPIVLSHVTLENLETKSTCWWKVNILHPLGFKVMEFSLRGGESQIYASSKFKRLWPPPPEKFTHYMIDLSDFYGNNSASAQCVACCTCNSTGNKIKKHPTGKILVTFWCLELEIRLNWPKITYMPHGQ